MNIRTDQKDVLSLSFDGSVTRIEVEKIVPPSEEDWDAETYYRVIRFTTNTGEVLEVACSAHSGEDLNLVEVDELEPAQPVRSRSQRNWLTPQRSKRKAG